MKWTNAGAKNGLWYDVTNGKTTIGITNVPEYRPVDR